MSKTRNLPRCSEALRERIDSLCVQGDAETDLYNFPAALAFYWAAWDLLPEPRHECEAATAILAAIGDANFLGGDFEAGCDNLSTVMHCPGAIGIPYLHFRLGQCHYELGDLARATDELMRAFHGGGASLFDDEDPKYLACLHDGASARQDAKGWRFWR